jgi:uncharacterized membrane protein ArfC
MQHVHWWLFALSFLLGLGLTFMLLRRDKPEAEVQVPETPTTKIRVAKDPPTTKIPVPKDPPTTKIPVPKDPPTTKIPAPKEAPTIKIPVAKKETPTTKIPTVQFAPYGAGSARAGADGGGPAGWLVKGRSDTRHYYTPDDAAYERTVAQVWFKDEESALRAYFTPWRKGSKK